MNLSHARPGPSGGFSLIELLAAIAVVAILALLVSGATIRVRSDANRTACLSNQRQIGLALQLYAADNGGEFPPTTHTTGRKRIEQSWIYGIGRYLGEIDEIRICPAEPSARKKTILDRRASSYPVNDLVFDDPSFNGPHKLPFPSRTFLVFTLSEDRAPSGTQDHIHGDEWTSWAGALGDIEPDRHRAGKRAADRLAGSANYLFADGHAENIPAAGFKAFFDKGINPAEVPESAEDP